MPQYTVEDLMKMGARPAAADIPPIAKKSYSVEDLMKLGAKPAVTQRPADDRNAQQVADDQALSVIEGFKNVFRHPIDTVSGMVGGVAKGVEAYMQGGPYGLTPVIAEAAKPVTDLARGAAALGSQQFESLGIPHRDYLAPTPEEFKQSAEFAGQNAATLLAGEAIAKVGPPLVKTGAASTQAAAEGAGIPTKLRNVAATLQKTAKTPSLPTSTTPHAIATAVIKGTSIPLAKAAEVVADWMSTPEGKLRTMKAVQAAEAESKARIQSLQPATPEGGPTGNQPTPPGVSALDQRWLDSLREDVAVNQRVADAQERASANRNAETSAAPQPSKAAPPPPGVSALNQEFLKNPPSTATVPVPPEFINKWMNVPSKEVMHGANPGAQLLEEKLIGPTKEATKANVDTALKDAGLQMNARLKAAGASGVTIDAQTPVYDATTKAVKRIGAPKDSTFTAQINGIVDDIEARYPDLSRLSPEQAHALKVDLGEAIKWTGDASALPANQAMIEIYRDLNKATKAAVPDIANIQDRWANLYIASKSLRASLAKDIAGTGTGPKPIPKK